MRAAARWLVLALALIACGPDCYLELVEGSDDNRDGLVHQGDVVRYEAHIDGHTLECGGIWLVNGIVGGSDGFGAIDECGQYAAPAVFPTGTIEVVIEATFPGRAGVSDGKGVGCEYAYATLRAVP